MDLELAPLPAQSEDVRAHARSWRQSAGVVDESGQATRSAFETVVGSWFGSLLDRVTDAPRPMRSDAERLQAEIVYNASVLDFWAQALQVLREKRTALIAQFDQAGPSYGAKYVDPDDVEAADVARARETNQEAARTAKRNLAASLQKEYSAAVDDLDDAAATVARLMELGATPQNLRFLYERGALRDGDIPLFHGIFDLFELLHGGFPAELEGKTAAEIAAVLEKNPELAAWAMQNQPTVDSADPAERALSLALAVPGDPKARMDAIRAAFAGMSEEDRNRMAVLFPGVVGNLNGVPFAQRAKANRIALVDGLDKEKARLDRLKRDLARVRDLTPQELHDKGYGFPDGSMKFRLEDLIGESERRIKRYDGLLNEQVPNWGAEPGQPGTIHRQVLYFHPDGNKVGIVTLEGRIDGDTKNIGMFVPGTGTMMSSFDGPVNTAGSFVVENAGKDLAMIMWAGGEFPAGLSDAASSGYATGAAVPLAEFSYALDQEIRANAESVSGQNVEVTTLGHSYGGAIVGQAQTVGLYTDNVVHIESAGMGDGVSSTSDYHPPSGQPPTTYTMNAPGDPIWVPQNTWLGQGSDSNDVEHGFTQLETGNYPAVYPEHPELAGQKLEGGAAHGGVVIEGTDAWWNMYGVLTDGPLSLKELEPALPPVVPEMGPR